VGWGFRGAGRGESERVRPLHGRREILERELFPVVRRRRADLPAKHVRVLRRQAPQVERPQVRVQLLDGARSRERILQRCHLGLKHSGVVVPALMSDGATGVEGLSKCESDGRGATRPRRG